MQSNHVLAIMAAIIYAAGMQGEPVAYPEAVDAAKVIFLEARRVTRADLTL